MRTIFIFLGGLLALAGTGIVFLDFHRPEPWGLFIDLVRTAVQLGMPWPILSAAALYYTPLIMGVTILAYGFWPSAGGRRVK